MGPKTRAKKLKLLADCEELLAKYDGKVINRNDDEDMELLLLCAEAYRARIALRRELGLAAAENKKKEGPKAPPLNA